MNLHTTRICVLAGLLSAPVVAFAQEEAPPSGTQRTRSALAMGLRSHSLSVDAVTPEAPAFAVDLEQPVMQSLTVFGGFHLGVGMDAVGLQAGSRLYVGGEALEGLFLAVQGEGTLFEGDAWVSGSRMSVGGLVGYSQTLGEKWLVSLGAGADVSRTRTETVVPPSPGCILFTPCLVAGGETRVEKEESVQPLVRLAAVYRF